MEKIASLIAGRMVVYDLIRQDDAKFYAYAVQIRIERLMAALIILAISVYLKAVVEIASFLLSFILIRRHSDGFHCDTSIGCLFTSSLLSASTVYIVPILKNNSFLCLGGAVLAMIITLIIGTVDNPGIGFFREELKYHKRHSRITVLILTGITVFLLYNDILCRLNGFLAAGIIYNGVILIMGKIKYGGQKHD